MASIKYRLQWEKGRAPFPIVKNNLISNLALSKIGEGFTFIELLCECPLIFGG